MNRERQTRHKSQDQLKEEYGSHTTLKGRPDVFRYIQLFIRQEKTLSRLANKVTLHVCSAQRDGAPPLPRGDSFSNQGCVQLKKV